MSVFNPKILDASIRDVTSDFTEEAKVDVLIYAMQYLKLERSVPPIYIALCPSDQQDNTPALGRSSKTQSSLASVCPRSLQKLQTRHACCVQRPGSQPAFTLPRIKVGVLLGCGPWSILD